MDGKGFWVMVFNTTFNNISVILWRSVLLLEETRVPGEKCRPAASQTKRYYIMMYRVKKGIEDFPPDQINVH